MPNSYFRFKQFTITQKHSAMKVTTDACLLGAIAPVAHAAHVLDIGAGTGLLSLMAAQRTNAHINAIELDNAAAGECADNFNASPWKQRLQILNTDFTTWADNNTQTWDVILCNPPFFTNHLTNHDENIRLARHTNTLSADVVISFAAQHLEKAGILCLLAPAFMRNDLITSCTSAGFTHIHITDIKDSPAHAVKRVLLFAAFNGLDTHQLPIEIVIKDDGGNYTEGFKKYVAPYYLHISL